MSKHKKDDQFGDTRGNPVIRFLKNEKNTPSYRVAKDVLILTRGWNATEEAKDFASMTEDEYRAKYHNVKGKHGK